MNTHSKSLLAASVATALGGAAGQADAALYTATLTQAATFSNNGSSVANISSSTGLTFTYNDVTQVLTQTGGTYNGRFTTAPTSTLYRHTITGIVIGNGAPATAASFVCSEGNFGGNVGASICGNYNFGANATNDSTITYGPGTASSRTIGGDDGIIGPLQRIVNYDGMVTTAFDATAPGNLVLSNATCTATCTTQPVGTFNNGIRWTLSNLTLVVQGPNDDTANAESGVATDISVLANDTGFADPVTVTIETAPNNGGSAVVVGSPGAAAGIKITYTSAPGFSGTETFAYRATDGSIDDTATVTVTVVDTVPTAFTFATQTGVALGTVVTSANATIGGISQAVPVSVSGGTYSVGCTATYISTASTIANGQDVCVRHTSAATPAADTVTTLTVGGVAGTFTSTTVPADTIPDAFTFPAQTGVAASTAITSAAAVIGGINTATPISITGGQYSINGGGYTAAAGTVTNGQSVTVRVTSSAAPTTATSATVTIGGVDGVFTVTTAGAGADLTPNQFTFIDREGVDRDTVIESAPVTITGIDGPAPILVTGGEYSIDGGAYTSVQGTVTNGQQVTVRHTSASTQGTVVSTRLDVGPAGAGTRVSDTFSSRTTPGGGSSAADGLILSVLGLLGLAGRRRQRR
jgi:hypothetical protein